MNPSNTGFYNNYIAELSVTLHEKTNQIQLKMYGKIQNIWT